MSPVLIYLCFQPVQLLRYLLKLICFNVPQNLIANYFQSSQTAFQEQHINVLEFEDDIFHLPDDDGGDVEDINGIEALFENWNEGNYFIIIIAINIHFNFQF